MSDIAMRFSAFSLVGKIARLPLKLVPKGSVVRVLTGTLRGARWVVGAGVHGCWIGIYEADKQRRFVAHIKPGMTVYDLGAHVGFYTLLASRLVMPSGRVFAFEPSPQNLPQLRRHVELNKATNVKVLPCAVAEARGEMGFESSASFGEAQGYVGHISSHGQVRVAVEAIDQLLAEGAIMPAQVVKIDVEGAELLALRGGGDFFKQHRPTLFLATHGPEVHRACCDLLREWGYELSSLNPNRGLETTDEVLAVAGPPVKLSETLNSASSRAVPFASLPTEAERKSETFRQPS